MARSRLARRMIWLRPSAWQPRTNRAAMAFGLHRRKAEMATAVTAPRTVAQIAADQAVLRREVQVANARAAAKEAADKAVIEEATARQDALTAYLADWGARQKQAFDSAWDRREEVAK